MATTKKEIKKWFEDGKKMNATHLIVFTDTFDWEDYPVYVMPNEDVRRIISERGGNNMQKVTEVYDLTKEMVSQLNEYRAFNY